MKMKQAIDTAHRSGNKSDRPGHASSMARGILGLHGYQFDTRFELPGGDSEEFITLPPGGITPALDGIMLYPNPTDGSIINVSIPVIEGYGDLQLDIWTMTGMKVHSVRLHTSANVVHLPDYFSGALAFRISGDGHVLKTGRLIINR